jgi:hypothetical protein
MPTKVFSSSRPPPSLSSPCVSPRGTGKRRGSRATGTKRAMPISAGLMRTADARARPKHRAPVRPGCSAGIRATALLASRPVSRVSARPPPSAQPSTETSPSAPSQSASLRSPSLQARDGMPRQVPSGAAPGRRVAMCGLVCRFKRMPAGAVLRRRRMRLAMSPRRRGVSAGHVLCRGSVQGDPRALLAGVTWQRGSPVGFSG